MPEPINLPDPIRQFADAQVTSGRFASVSEYIGALVSADEQTQNSLAGLKYDPEIEALLEEGLRGGEGRYWSPKVRDELKQRVLDRAAGKKP